MQSKATQGGELKLMLDVISFSGNEIAHLIGALTTAPLPNIERDREIRWNMLARSYTLIKDKLSPDVQQAIEQRLEELQ
jgi:hypothetical protein